MAVAKRIGPDFLFLANKHSTKFSDLDQNKEVQVSFQDAKSTQNWISISGTAITTSNSDPRIKDIWSRGASAWFGDLGDGKHTGEERRCTNCTYINFMPQRYRWTRRPAHDADRNQKQIRHVLPNRCRSLGICERGCWGCSDGRCSKHG